MLKQSKIVIISGQLLSEATELNNPFTKQAASPQQREDLLNFYLVGEREFEKYIEYHILRRPSTKAPNRKRKLLTLSERKATRTQINQLEKDKKLVTKCLHRRLMWHQQTKVPLVNLAEQYITFPLAISDNSGVPIKGQKSNATKFYAQRYEQSEAPVIFNDIPTGWVPQSVLIEGMFIINTTPLGTHKTFGDYALFLFRRFIMVHFNRGCKEVHAIFDNPGRLELPKGFERERRDKTVSVTVHTCDKIKSSLLIPTKWREYVINCRQCKRSLATFLCKYWLEKAAQYLEEGMTLYTAGAHEVEDGDTAWSVSIAHPKPQLEPAYNSNAEETDTRIWLHVQKSSQKRFYIVSPDTDVYHIGLPLGLSNKEILIEINTTGSHKKRILSLSNLKCNLNNDPDLSAISSKLLPKAMQALYAVTGCDYTSFFSGIGKITFMKCFFQHAEFISSAIDYAGSLSDTSLNTECEMGFLAFMRLVGTAYFKKYASAFREDTPQAHFNTYSGQDGGESTQFQHSKWLENIRNSIWDRTQFENNMLPSVGALYRHWMRACWVLDMWGQAANTEMHLKPMALYGWTIQAGKLEFDWDSDENIRKVQTRVHSLLKGCKCTKGCKTNACGCKRQGQHCTEGCQCNGCCNLTETTTKQFSPGLNITDGEDYESDCDSNTDARRELEDDVNDIMRTVFGDNSWEDI